MDRLLGRLVCLWRGHAYSAKDVLVLPYSKATMDTCDRCGNGDADLAHAKKLAAPYQPLPEPPQ